MLVATAYFTAECCAFLFVEALLPLQKLVVFALVAFPEDPMQSCHGFGLHSVYPIAKLISIAVKAVEPIPEFADAIAMLTGVDRCIRGTVASMTGKAAHGGGCDVCRFSVLVDGVDTLIW